MNLATNKNVYLNVLLTYYRFFACDEILFIIICG